MKFRKLLISMAALLIVGVAIFQVNQKNDDPRARYDERGMKFMEHTKGIKKAMEYLASMKGERMSGHIDPREVVKARLQLKNNASGQKALGLQWDNIGPGNVGGRTRGLCIDPDNPNTMYAGGVSGGLWKTTTGGSSWTLLTDVDENLSISSVEMGPNGEIYVGTGEQFANVLGNNYSTPGVIGTGIYKSTDGTNFDLIPSTIPSASNSSSVAWAFVNRIAVDTTDGDVWAATNNGLKYSDDGGSTWQDPPLLPNGQPLTGNSMDVKISPNGMVAAVVGTSVYISKTGGINDFTNVSTGDPNMLPGSDISRVELAMAHNNQTIYAVMAKGGPLDDPLRGSLKNIYMSDDKGDTWSVVGPGGSESFAIFGSNNQGAYDNVIAVDPDNPHHVFVGGINMWEGTQVNPGQPFAWQQITQGYLDQLGGAQTSHYAHVDHHVYKFHPNNSSVMYAGTDGGIFRTTNKGNTFTSLNKNYNVTQFYTLAIGPRGGVMGGTQDNSTPYVSGHGNTPTDAEVLFYGDGGHAAFSVLDQDIFFASSYYGLSGRSLDKGNTWERQSERDSEDNEVPGYYSQRLIDEGYDGSFVTPIKLWESVSVSNSRDSVWYKDTVNSHSAGDTLIVRSQINDYPFQHILNQPLNQGDSVQVADPVQSRYYLGTHNAVWMTRDALDFSVTPEWFKIANINGTVQRMQVSEDGDVMYVGTQGGTNSTGRIYRINNIMSAWDSTYADVTSSQQSIEVDLIKEFAQGRWVTSIALDPEDKDHIIVTLGNYGESNYVYRSTNAMSTNPTFQSVQGDLPAMPIYASLVPMFNSNSVILGTEYGIYATDDITASSVTWVEENDGFDRVPVYMLGQQTMNLPYMEITETVEGQQFTTVYPGVSNYGKVYAATYGRGFYSTDKYTGVQEKSKSFGEVQKLNINLYPNPVSDQATADFKLDKPSDVLLRVYDINGRLMNVREEKLSSGKHSLKFDVSNMEKGNYILQMIYDGNKTTSKKFIVY
ncbi:MAG: T9SS type A sorting domain-containing protein [Bacteroidales bacterium]|nr:T9SS type A sorting domain-containing protein [Bacteroidales bacterium]MCF8327510.1 T9SS type A sorting domain-containing protein [Bacteroidales bacterium]